MVDAEFQFEMMKKSWEGMAGRAAQRCEGP